MIPDVDVVISGIGGMFPNSSNLEEFRDILMRNECTIGPNKWNPNLRDLCNNFPANATVHFDAPFFGIHRSQTIFMNPMARIALEKTYEAVVDAGVNVAELRGSNIAVFIGTEIEESDGYIIEPVKSGFGITGHARNMLSNRISYWFNLTGPSCPFHANWLGSITALEAAVDLIRKGIVDGAIVGGTNCITNVYIQKVMEKTGLIAKDGKTKAFDDNADGYSRADACVMLFLQRSDLAKRSYGSILHVSTLFNGNQEKEICHFNSKNFIKFLQECYEKAGINPNDVEYLEAHGSGIKTMDEVELEAVEEVFCKNRAKPLRIGSVKSCVGHAEPVAPLLSLVKVILAMETGVIPANLFYNTPNKNIPALINKKVEVITKNEKWDGDIMAINALGLVASFGHIIFKRNPKTKPYQLHTEIPSLLCFSTRTEEGIQSIINSESLNKPDIGFNHLVHEVFNKNIPGHLYRGYVLKGITEKSDFKFYSGNKRQVWFIYSGMGSQWHKMGCDLMKLPIFSESVQKCHEALKPKGIDLIKIITTDDPTIFDNILNSFVGIAAIQIGLTDVLKAIGITPDGLIGHSVGELGCAYADGALTAEQMILSAYYRGQATLDAELIVGMMAAIGMGYKHIKPFCPDTIDVACHNAYDSCTISGPTKDVQKFVEILLSKHIFAKLVNVSNVAYHSRYIKPAAPLLLSYLKEVILNPKKRSEKWISTSVMQKDWNTDLAQTVSAEYLTNNLLSSVLFEEALPFIPNDAIVIEIAPHGLLQAILKRALSTDTSNVSLTRRNSNCLEFFFNSLGQLYTKGVNINLSPLYPPVSHPVIRGTRSLCNLIHWEHGEEWQNAESSLQHVNCEKTYIINLNTQEFEMFNKYKIDGKIHIPTALYIDCVIKTFAFIKKYDSITLENVRFINAITIVPEGSVSIVIMIQRASGAFEINNANTLIANGILKAEESFNEYEYMNVQKFKKSVLPGTVIDKDDFYMDLHLKQYNFHNAYKCINSVTMNENGAIASLNKVDNWMNSLSAMLQVHLFHNAENIFKPLIPKFIQQISISFDEKYNNVKDPSIYFEKLTGVLGSNCGINISGIYYTEANPHFNPLTVENVEFIPICNKINKDTQESINISLQIVAENIGSHELKICELKDKYSPSYLTFIENSVKNSNLKTENFSCDNFNNNEITNLFTILSGDAVKDVSGEDSINNFTLLSVSKGQSVSIPNKNIVAQFVDEKHAYYLCKKINKSPVKVITANDSILSYVQNNGKLAWIKELKSLLLENQFKVYLVARVIPEEGIKKFIMEIQNNVPNNKNLRFMFLLDNTAPECTPTSKFYANIFEKDLLVSVLKNGEWGSYVNLCKSIEPTQELINNSIVLSATSPEFASICKVNYLGLHAKDLSQNVVKTIPCEIGAVDYSGTNSFGCNIMGIAKTDQNECRLLPDPEFSWPVPFNWKLSDAATVPFAYTMAYYSLFHLGEISKGKTVLVHAGFTPIGQAALHVASNYDCVVYTTVATEHQKNMLLKLLPEMPEQNILSSENCRFEQEILLQTKGKGADVIINFFCGKQLHASKRCLATFGRLILLNTRDVEEHETTGMNIFLKNISFFGVRCENLFDLDFDVKKQIHKMIALDIENSIVRPISKKIFSQNRIDHVLSYLQNNKMAETPIIHVNKIFVNNKYNNNELIMRFDPKQQYLIYGDMKNSWLYLVEWLIKRGARKILVAKQTRHHQNYINRYLSLLKRNYSAEILIIGQNASTLQTTRNLFNEFHPTGMTTDVFVFPMDDERNKSFKSIVRNIDTVLHERNINARMVCFVGQAKDEQYIRINEAPICNIIWEKDHDVLDIFRNMDFFLINDNLTVTIKNDDVCKSEVLYEDSLLLPNSLKILKQLGQISENDPCIVPLNSKATRLGRENEPIFIVPDLSGPFCPHLREFAKQLMYPVFCLNLRSLTFENDVVNYLTEEICKTKDSDIYELVGVSWGGVLAIEIAKELEYFGKKVNLHLIEGIPKKIQSFTAEFNKSGYFNMDLLMQKIVLENSKTLNEVLQSPSATYSKKDIILFEKALDVLKNFIEYSNYYKPKKNKIVNQVKLFVTDDLEKLESNMLMEHCAYIRHKVIKENIHSLMLHSSLLESVNSNVGVSFD